MQKYNREPIHHLKKFRLKGKWVNKLANMPESGMGYQIVDITLKDGQVIKEVTILYCDEVYIPDGCKKFKEENIVKIEMSK